MNKYGIYINRKGLELFKETIKAIQMVAASDLRELKYDGEAEKGKVRGAFPLSRSCFARLGTPTRRSYVKRVFTHENAILQCSKMIGHKVPIMGIQDYVAAAKAYRESPASLLSFIKRDDRLRRNLMSSKLYAAHNDSPPSFIELIVI